MGLITRSARRLTLHLPRRSPWETQFSRAMTQLREFPAVYSLAIPRIAAPADGHGGIVRRLKPACRPPIYPNGARAISPVSPSPLSPVLTPSSGALRWIEAYWGRVHTYVKLPEK